VLLLPCLQAILYEALDHGSNKLREVIAVGVLSL